MTRLFAAVVLLAAGLAGAAVMVVEVAGAHALAPNFGVGLNAWAAMIVVALGGLACGYALGGVVADRWRRAARGILAAALAVAGLACAADALCWDSPFVARLAELGPRRGAVAAAAVLFLPTFVALGAVYPLAVKLWTRTVDEVGRRTGWLSAVSTVGSLLGAGAAGFVLVPTLAMEAVFAQCAAALLVMAVVVYAWGPGRRSWRALLIPVGLAPLFLPPAALPEGVLYRRGSLFGPLEVWESGIVRHLMVARACQGSGIVRPAPPDRGTPGQMAPGYGDIADPGLVAEAEPDRKMRSYLPHTAVISGMLGQSLLRPESRALLIGLGAGFIPRQLAPVPCDTVEIDPAIVDAAERFFEFSQERHPVHIADGRAFLLTARTRYDAIIIDALRGGDVPHHLVTRECFRLARRRLHSDGILVVNVQGFVTGPNDKLVRSIERTLRAVFGEVDLCVNPHPPGNANVILAAHRPGLEIVWPVQRGYEPAETLLDSRPAPILTDSRNPVALWCAQAERRRAAARP